ncbi:MAG: hypothetical protein HYX71_11275 [Opitutae bacterium]|nr:hypothetical protein [Opitutae bacterium]
MSAREGVDQPRPCNRAKPNRNWYYALNESGQAAGNSGNRAVIWTDRVPTDIQILAGAYDSVAFAINDIGQAAGDVSPTENSSSAFFWNNITMKRILPPAGEYIVEA